jgi:beta-lactamase superfamily II metal-dependent hydrolase
MASKPTSVEVRGYQVGFGDCFLVSFVYAGQHKRHVLIDFGTTGLPRGLKPSTYMPQVARAIEADCGGQLTAVVATHRHADHISGFATDAGSGASGKIIAQCKPKVVLQPWTEDPRAASDARKATADSSRSAKRFVAGLAAMHQVAAEVASIAASPPRSMSIATANQLRFLGESNIKNKSAVDNLIRMGASATAVWAHHGSKSGLERLLPGVKVRVLGPPDLTQTEKIRRMRSSDPDEFWQLLGGAKALSGLGGVDVNGAKPAKGRSRAALPAEARWFCNRLAVMTNEQLLEIVRILDEQMNNTSLILLFEVGKKKLLFPGDAQIENWSYALQDAPDAAATRKLLAGVDLYKVGHHGSRNATPKQLLWQGFSKRGGPQATRLRTMLSTMPGKHGTSGKRTEVPRKTLLQALESETVLLSTNKFKKGEMCRVTEVTV